MVGFSWIVSYCKVFGRNEGSEHEDKNELRSKIRKKRNGLKYGSGGWSNYVVCCLVSMEYMFVYCMVYGAGFVKVTIW